MAGWCSALVLAPLWIGLPLLNGTARLTWRLAVNAVLFFDEADAIAARRAAGAPMRSDREANLTVNVLLRELEAFNGIVIFATNLAANFDPAFERRIRTHVLFEIPGVAERAEIWQLQIHPRKTPLAADVDFRILAERYVISGGDIKNAVIKAAAAAAAEPGADLGKRIHQRHFESGADDVLSAKNVMRQSLFTGSAGALIGPSKVLSNVEAHWRIAIVTALGLAGTAFLAALLALLLVLFRG